MQMAYPYFELARLDRPVGIPIIVFPYFYGFFFALLTEEPSVPKPSYIFPVRLPLLLLSGSILRAVGCAWNDIVDADVDRRVKRTRSRPIARGAISIRQASTFTVFLWCTWILTVTPFIPEPQRLGIYTVPLISMVTAYPYAKRVTSYAQVWLGLTLGWGVLLGAAMADFDVLERLVVLRGGSVGLTIDSRTQGALALYAAYIVWTVIYDTIYAFQDVKGDKEVGVNSMALRLGNYAKPVLGCLALLEVVLLACVGGHMLEAQRAGKKGLFSVSRAVWPYTYCALLPSGLIHSIMLVKVDLASPKSCAYWFKFTSIAIGFSMALGFVLQYVVWVCIIDVGYYSFAKTG